MSLSIRLPQEIEQRLERLSSKTGRTKSFYVKQALLEHLDDMEDAYLAESRLENIRAGLTKTIPLEDLIKRYGLED
jgi:RHH-type rel operon transcriptional repressor/antitoxin RelB